MYRRLITFIFCVLCAQSLCAQSLADSLALVTARWDTLCAENQWICRRVSLRLWESDQQIAWLEYHPTIYRITIVQNRNRETVRRMAHQHRALGAINGGFFVTKSQRAVANDFLKIQDSIYPSAGGWANAAVAIETGGALRFIPWGDSTRNQSRHSPYPNILAAGPMLLWDGRVQVACNSQNQDRHPRSVVGVRADGTVIFFVVDGRQRGADGMTFSELAYTARLLGLVSALNLDGGGSSTLWVEGQGVVNRPSDRVAGIRVPRRVANALVVQPKE